MYNYLTRTTITDSAQGTRKVLFVLDLDTPGDLQGFLRNFSEGEYEFQEENDFPEPPESILSAILSIEPTPLPCDLEGVIELKVSHQDQLLRMRIQDLDPEYSLEVTEILDYGGSSLS